MMTLMQSRNGLLQVLEFHPDRLHPDDDGIPLVFVLVAAQCEGHTLLIHHAKRLRWELPGGGIEPGEAPAACAARELWEESGQVATALEYRGLFKLRFTDDERLEYAMLYGAHIDSLQPFTANAETDRILLWDRRSALDDELGELDEWLLRCC